ncbi:MAG: DMT family transporter [Thermodesulfobacteriota bacterium]
MDRLIGIFLIVVAAASFATSPIFARIAYGAGANPNTFLFIRFAIAATVLTFVMVFKGLQWPRGRLLISLVLIGGVCFAGLNLSFYTALTLAPVNLVIVIAYMYPALVTLLSALFLKQPITKQQYAALFLTLVGVVVTTGLDWGGQHLGIVLAITTAVIYSAYFTFGSLSIRKAGPVPASAVIFISVTIVYSILVAIQGFRSPTAVSGWAAIILCALFSTVFGIICLYEGLKRVDPANTAIVSTFEVVVAAILAILILGETMSMSKIIGACMIIIAVTILGRGEYKTARGWVQ